MPPDADRCTLDAQGTKIFKQSVNFKLQPSAGPNPRRLLHLTFGCLKWLVREVTAVIKVRLGYYLRARGLPNSPVLLIPR